MTDLLKHSDGGISYIARHGAGPTVVFLHGIGSNATSFLPVFDILPRDLNLIAWNAPGYLDTPPVDDLWPVPESYAKVLLKFLDELNIATFYLVGHSLGTLIAASFARRFSGRLDGLVLASAASGYAVPRGGEMPPRVLARIEDLEKVGPTAFAEARAANLVHDPANNEQIVAQVKSAMSRVHPSGYAQAVRLLASGNLSADLAQSPIRPGFIVGKDDRVTPVEQTIAAASSWENAHKLPPHVHAIEGAGHAVYLQKPHEFCSALLDLLKLPQQAA